MHQEAAPVPSSRMEGKFNKRWKMGVGERGGILKTQLLRLASQSK
tara:strand:- start:5079 stop:5213 length:135 start_codon:yes stop_codon:yes gene_type:complete